MNEGIHTNSITRVASADAKRGAFVKLGADSTKVEVCSATDANCIGVLLDDVVAGDNVAVALLGVANSTFAVLAGGAIQAGDRIALAGDGKCQTLPQSNGSYVVVGRALSAGVGDGDIVEIIPQTPVSVTIS